MQHLRDLRHTRSGCAALLFLTCVMVAIAAHADDVPAAIPLNRWLAEPDHSSIKWNFRVRPPKLTYELRQMVLIEVAVPTGSLQRHDVHRDLHVMALLG